MKSLFKSSVYNITYKVFTLMFPLISATYVSRILMAEGVGKAALAQNVVSYFIMLATLGMMSHGTREIGRVQKDPDKYSITFMELLTISIVSTCICSAAYFIMILNLSFFKENMLLYSAAGVQLILSGINVDWFYQGIEEYGYITVRSIIIKVFTLIAMFCLIKTSNDVIFYVLLSSIALVGNNILNLYHLRRYIRFKRSIISKMKPFKHMKTLLVLLSTMIAVELYTKLDTTMLGLFASERNVGYFTYATKLSSMLIGITASVSIILLPRLSYYFQNGLIDEFRNTVKMSYKTLLVITFPCTVGMIMVSDTAVLLLFGEDFAPASLTIKILSLLMIIKSIGNLYGTQVLLTLNFEKKLFYTTVVGAVSNIMLNSVLIPMWAHNGTAAASVASELIVMTLQMVFAKKYVNYGVPKGFLRTIFIPLLTMAFCVWMIQALITNLYISLLLSIVTGIVIYLGLGLIMKNEIMIYILKRVKKNFFLYIPREIHTN